MTPVSGTKRSSESQSCIQAKRRCRVNIITQRSHPFHFACQTLNQPFITRVLWEITPEERLSLLFTQAGDEDSPLQYFPRDNMAQVNEIKKYIAKHAYIDIDREFETFEALLEKIPTIESDFGINKYHFLLIKGELSDNQLSGVSEPEIHTPNIFGQNLLAIGKHFERSRSALSLYKLLYNEYFYSPTPAKARNLELSSLHIDCLSGKITEKKLASYRSRAALLQDRFGNTPLHLLTLFLPDNSNGHQDLNIFLTMIKDSHLFKNWNIRNNADFFPLDLFSSNVNRIEDLTTQLRLSEWYTKCRATPIGILGAPESTRLKMEDITPLWRSVKHTTRTQLFSGTSVPIHPPRALRLKDFSIYRTPTPEPLEDNWSPELFIDRCPLQGSIALIKAIHYPEHVILAIQSKNTLLTMQGDAAREKVKSKIAALNIDLLVEGLCFKSQFSTPTHKMFTSAIKSLLAWMVIVDDFNEESHALASSDHHYARLKQILLGSTTIDDMDVDLSNYGFDQDPMYTMLEQLINQIDAHIPENLRSRYKRVFWDHIYSSRKEKEVELWRPPFSLFKLVELEKLGIETVGIKVLYEIILAQSGLDIDTHPYYKHTMNQLGALGRHGNNIQSICKELKEDINGPLLVDHLRLKIRALRDYGNFSISFPVLFAHINDSCLLYGIHQESLRYHQQLLILDKCLPSITRIYDDLTNAQQFALYSTIFWTTMHVPEWTASLKRYQVVAEEGIIPVQ